MVDDARNSGKGPKGRRKARRKGVRPTPRLSEPPDAFPALAMATADGPYMLAIDDRYDGVRIDMRNTVICCHPETTLRQMRGAAQLIEDSAAQDPTETPPPPPPLFSVIVNGRVYRVELCDDPKSWNVVVDVDKRLITIPNDLVIPDVGQWVADIAAAEAARMKRRR